MTAYKLLRVRRDGSLGPLFIGRRQRIPLGVRLPAEDIPTPGYAHRPGWHACAEPRAPHLSARGRAWFQGDDSDLGRVLRDAAREMATPEGLTDATAAALSEAFDAFDTEAGPS